MPTRLGGYSSLPTIAGGVGQEDQVVQVIVGEVCKVGPLVEHGVKPGLPELHKNTALDSDLRLTLSCVPA